jgi:hypothetical protein
MPSPLDADSAVRGGELQTPSWWALAIGIALAAIPLVHFGALDGEDGGHHEAYVAVGDVGSSASDHSSEAGPHMDHSPHHGGQLGMSGDYHIELVERGDTIEVHLSNAERQPLKPAGGSLSFDTGTAQRLAPFSSFLLAPRDKEAHEVTVAVTVGSDTQDPVEISFLLGQ